MKKKKKYDAGLPERMYEYFRGFDEASGAPSFGKFAASEGLTTAELCALRRYRHFDEAYLECREIRRDFLIDRALSRRFDPSFVKHLLGLEYGEAEERGEDKLTVTVEVVS